jgi:chromosome segregation ATPase
MSEDEHEINYTGPIVKDESSLPEAIKSLFSFAFTLNCHIDEASITEEERETLSNLDMSELFENFKDLIIDLLKFKLKFKQTEISEIVNRSEQFENIIQKLEAKVRTHIGIEQQLKLHIETQQGQLEEMLKNNGRKIEEIGKEAESKGVKERMVEVEKEVKKKDGEITRLGSENARLRKIIEDKSRQMQLLRKELKPKGDYLESGEYIKKQIEEQNSQIIRIQQKRSSDKNQTKDLIHPAIVVNT